MKYLFYITLFLFVSISCSTNHDYDNEYDKFISELDHIPIQDSLRIESDDSSVYRAHDLVSYSNGKFIIVDASTWTLYLMNGQGDFIDSTGGAGRGPNEFSQINQIHRGTDDQIYVFDALSQDITIYSISDNAFQLKKEMALPAYEDALRLKAIYKTNSGFVGVFKRGVGLADKENTFGVYRLGEDLQLQAHLFDMPANETYTTQQGRQSENPMGATTMWGMADGRFYYSNTHDLSVTAVQIADSSSTEYDFADVPKPVKGEEEIKAIESRVRGVNPQMMEFVREGQYMPSFRNFLPTQDYFYYTLFRVGKANGILLRVNKETKEMRKIIVPPVFNLLAVRGDTLYGIDYTTFGAPEIMILKI